MVLKQTLCLDCKGPVLSTGKLKKRCPTCQDIYRNKKNNKRAAEKRRKNAQNKEQKNDIK
jgi:tRNA(Ile2) C34 agmatinyltransferase TiaS